MFNLRVNPGMTGLGVREAGLETNRRRRADIMGENMAAQMDQPAFGPLRGLYHGLGLGGSSDWDAYFGALQNKEAEAADRGKRFRFDVGGWGNTKTEPLYHPTWDVLQGQSSAVGDAYGDEKGNIYYNRRFSPLSGLRNAG